MSQLKSWKIHSDKNMEIMTNIGTAIGDKGWRQGYILREEDWQKLAADYGWDDQKKAIIVSQSCDLTNGDIGTEPYAEVVVGNWAESHRPELMYGKHPRSLHLPIQQHGADRLTLALRPWQRLLIPRERLAGCKPDLNYFLLRDDLRVLTTWLAQRYVRGALPDSFNDLIAQRRKKWEKLRKKLSSHVSELLIELHPEGELDAEEHYSVNLLALVPVDKKAMLEEAQQDVGQIADLMRSLNMEVRAAAKPEDEVSYSVVRRMTRFPLEHLSLRGEPFDPLPTIFDIDAE
nr:hypothetical protein [uncultured Halomonas sp.]